AEDLHRCRAPDRRVDTGADRTETGARTVAMKYWSCLLALLLVHAACAGQRPEEPGMAVVLDAQTREANLALPAGRAERVMVEVRPLPGQASGGTVSVFVEGSPAPLSRFTLYPPDQPSRFAVAVPA